MGLLNFVIIVFVFFISVNLIYRQRKRRKRDEKEGTPATASGYKSRLSRSATTVTPASRPSDRRTKHTGAVDYRAPETTNFGDDIL